MKEVTTWLTNNQSTGYYVGEMQNYDEDWDIRFAASDLADCSERVVSTKVTTGHILEMHTLVYSPSIKPNTRFHGICLSKKCETYC
jgi:hypothetical protein